MLFAVLNVPISAPLGGSGTLRVASPLVFVFAGLADVGTLAAGFDANHIARLRAALRVRADVAGLGDHRFAFAPSSGRRAAGRRGASSD